MVPVATLTNANMTTYLSTSSALVTLVLFSMPGCPHEPQKLRPTLFEAAGLLAPEHAVSIAVCDDAAAAEALGVRTFPALRLHRNDNGGLHLEPFRGPLHSPAALASRLRRDPRTTKVLLQADSAKAVRDEVDAVGQAVILFAREGSAAATAFLSLATSDRDRRLQVSFVLAAPQLAVLFDPEATEQLEKGTLPTDGGGAEAAAAHERPLLLLFRDFDEDIVVYSGGDVTDEGSVGRWIDAHRVPALAEIGPSNFETYERASVPLFWLFLNASCCDAENAHLKLTIAREGAARRGKAHFVWLDGDRYAHHMPRSLASHQRVLPVLAAEAHGAHYVYSNSLASADGVAAWVDLVLAGTLRPTLRSAAPPLHNSGPLTTVVASTFDELVTSAAIGVRGAVTSAGTPAGGGSGGDGGDGGGGVGGSVGVGVGGEGGDGGGGGGGGIHVLLLVTASWCSECARMHAEFERLAEAWSDEPRLRVAVLDAATNDVPRRLGVSALPSVLLFRALGGEAADAAVAAAEAEGIVVPVDLSHLQTAAALSEAVVHYAAGGLRRPADHGAVQEALAMLPRLQRESALLLQENERLARGNAVLAR